MGRSVFIEDVIEERISKLFGETKWASGVLIGQSTLQRDYVVHLVLTPSQESGASDDGSDKETVKKSKAMNEFDEEWFIQHCRQVNCMLTGGLRILGMFVFGPLDVRTRLQAKFRQTLYSVHKMISADFPLAKWKVIEQDGSQVMLHVCSETKKTTCYTIDVSDSKANIQPADLKYQNFVSKWISLHSSLELELNFMLQKKLDSRSRFSNLKSGLNPILSKIANSLATVNGAILSDEQQLVSEKQKGKPLDKNLIRNVDLYLTEDGYEPDITKCKSKEALLVGTVESQAFLHPKATVKEAVNAIKCDVIRSLLTRFRLLCEDMDDNDEQDEDNDDEKEKFSRWELPKRIFAPICRGHLRISDCVFKDEDIKDVLNRILEMIGVAVEDKDLISNEKFADDMACDQLLQDRMVFNNTDNIVTEDTSKNSTSHYPLFGAIGASVGALTAAMAALYSWYFNE